MSVLVSPEAIGYSEGKINKAVIHELGPIDVKEIRASVGMSQSEFASAFGTSVSRLRQWIFGGQLPND